MSKQDRKIATVYPTHIDPVSQKWVFDCCGNPDLSKTLAILNMPKKDLERRFCSKCEAGHTRSLVEVDQPGGRVTSIVYCNPGKGERQCVRRLIRR